MHFHLNRRNLFFWCWGEEIWTAIGEEEIEEYKVLGAAGGVGYRIKLLEKRKVPPPIKTWFIFIKLGILEIAEESIILLWLFLSALLLPDLRTQVSSVVQ